MLQRAAHANTNLDVDSRADARSNSCEPRFAIIGSGETRKDLARRREIKFVFRDADIDAVRDVLRTELQRQVHNDPVSMVRSIYFDSPKFAACHANLSGVGIRKKVRIRWYDSLEPGTQLFLEVKWRDNRITGKHRVELRSDRPLAEMTYDEIHQELLRVAPEPIRPQVELYCDPVVLVEYCREHYVAPGAGLRLTLDYNVKFYDQCGRLRPYTRFPIAADNLVVLEGKTAVGGEFQLRRLLEPLAARAHRCSKYVHGCHRIGAVPNTD
ncbi:MAG: polyphosphate polymerase domain-containing protein [Pirellulaceae bacterium]|nr:polyphosphate polymerase domain-containing protein [Planctomycetales bacterium]